MGDRDFSEERQQKIIEFVNAENRVNVDDLSRLFNVTQATVRRDLLALENRGLVYRAHGGAVKREQNSIWQMSSLQTRLRQHEEEKKRIALYISEIIHDGQSIMIDGGSTTTEAARVLCGKKNLLIVTNSLTIGEMFVESGNNKIILTGGELLKETYSLIGNATEHSLANYRCDAAIIGVSGIVPAEGCFSAIPQEAEVKNLMLRNSQKKIIITDSSKIGVHAFYQFCSMEYINLLITDRNIQKNDLAVLKKAGLEVAVV
ncbi:MAG: DeoR/GlpR family DNA-binding transcription regulator [Treponema sp.]|jgi:DeoR family transcriptional regulator of aga operon/DeoR family fructose operon transcriptional repressor|nr:DeoR/GlpR family DNA-binding transcription regulator [Treponema sp.]